MKCLLLFWTEPVPDGEQYADGFGTDADYQAWADLEARLKADGTFVDAGDLEAPSDHEAGDGQQDRDRLVRPDLAADRDVASPSGGGPVVSGYYVVDVPDLAAARAIAASMPLYGTVEVRPVVDYSAWS